MGPDIARKRQENGCKHMHSDPRSLSRAHFSSLETAQVTKWSLSLLLTFTSLHFSVNLREGPRYRGGGRGGCWSYRCHGMGRRCSASGDPHHAITGSAGALAVVHNDMRSKIKDGAGTRASSTARDHTNVQWVGRSRPLLVHRDRRVLARIGRHTVDLLNGVDHWVRHHDLHRHRLAPHRSCAGNIEMVLGIHDEVVGLLARVKSTAKYTLDAVHRDIRSETRLLSVTTDTAAHVGRQLESGSAARIVTAAHAVAVLDIVIPDLARIRGVALARVISNTLQLTSHSVLNNADQIEFAEGTRPIASAVQLANIDAIDIGSHARQIAVAVEGGTIFLVANHLDVFDAKTARVTVADNIGTIGSAHHLPAETAIEIVDTLYLSVSRCLHHPHFGTFIRIIA